MLRLRPTYEEIAREARTHRLRILPEKQKRTQQGLLLDDVDFDDFDLGKYDKKAIIMNDNPDARNEPRENRDKGTQTDVFNESPSITESESMKTIEEEVKQTQTDESEASVKSIEKEKETEREREQPQKKSVMRRVYDAMFGEDEFKEEREDASPEARELRDMRSRRQQIEQEEESEPPVEKQQTEESDDSLPMNVKKSYYPSSSSSSSRRSSNRSALLPIEEEALSEYVRSSPPVSVQSSSQSDASFEASGRMSDRTIEYVDDASASDEASRGIRDPSPPQSVISSRRSQETIEYIRSRTSSRRTSVQSVSS